MSPNSIDRVQVKLKAKSILKGNWPVSVGVTLVYFLAIFLVDYVIGFLGGFGAILGLLINSFLGLSLVAFFIKSINNKLFILEHFKISIKSFFKIFAFTVITSFSFIPYFIFLTYFIATSNFLWLILSLIGIFFAVYISLILFGVPYILIESDGEKGIFDSMKESYNLTKGFVVNLLVFTLSFLGWQILCIFSFGIGFLWLIPYMYVSQYIYYKKLLNVKFSEINFIKID